MKHSYLLMSAALCAGVTFGSSADNMSLSLKGRLASLAEETVMEAPAPDRLLPVIVSMSNPDSASELEQLGLVISERFGSILMGSAPVDKLYAIANHPDVLILDEPTEAYVNLNFVKPAIAVDKMDEEITGLVDKNGITSDHVPFNGNGVIVAVVDAGMQPSHPAFYNNERTELRIKQYVVTESASENGAKEVSAKVYDEPRKIVRAESKAFHNGHQTHVAGIAGGSYPTKEYRGIAPASDLWISNMGETMYTDEIIYSIKKAMEYADEKDQPVVVNFSVGSIRGSHNGKSALADAVNSAVGDGKIICFAAGNDGMYNMSLMRDFKAKPLEVKTCLVTATNLTSPAQNASIQIMSEDDTPFDVALTVVDKNSLNEIYSSNYLPLSEIKDDLYTYIYNASNETVGLAPELGKYIGGLAKIYGGYSEESGQFGVVIDTQFKNLDESRPVYAGLKVRSPRGAKVLIISNNTNGAFSDCGVGGYISGNPDNTISDYSTIERCISVGATNAREKWTTLDGVQGTLNQNYYGKLNGPAAYSSYGETFNAAATKLPLVLAPGTMVISAYNTRAYSYQDRRCVETEFEGDNYYWGLMTGSSMACPAVSGVIALWLEAYRHLTPETVKEIIAATAHRTELVEAQPYRCTTGIIDAYEGLKYIYKNYVDVSSVENLEAAPSTVMVRYLSGHDVECVVPSADNDAEVTLYDMEGRNLRSFTAQGVFNVNMPSAGCYILSVKTNGKTYTQRLLAK